MNPNIVQALNGVAIAAANAGDVNSVGILQQAACMISRIGTSYDKAATSASYYLNFNITPFSGEMFEADSATVKFQQSPPPPPPPSNDVLNVSCHIAVAFIPICS